MYLSLALCVDHLNISASFQQRDEYSNLLGSSSPCWMSTSMGGVGVLHMSWRPGGSLVSISGDGDKKDVSYFGGNVGLMVTCKL